MFFVLTILRILSILSLHVFTHTSEEFRKYFDHLLTLSFEDTPDYAYLKSLFRDLFRKHKYAYDSVLYDWEVLSTTGTLAFALYLTVLCVLFASLSLLGCG